MERDAPDLLTKAIRFICGFLFGVLITASATVSTLMDAGVLFAAVVAAVGVVFGVAAVSLGDAFWHRFAKWPWW